MNAEVNFLQFDQTKSAVLKASISPEYISFISDLFYCALYLYVYNLYKCMVYERKRERERFAEITIDFT